MWRRCDGILRSPFGGSTVHAHPSCTGWYRQAYSGRPVPAWHWHDNGMYAAAVPARGRACAGIHLPYALCPSASLPPSAVPVDPPVVVLSFFLVAKWQQSQAVSQGRMGEEATSPLILRSFVLFTLPRTWLMMTSVSYLFWKVVRSRCIRTCHILKPIVDLASYTNISFK